MHEEEAIALLQHYFAIALGKRSASELNSDYRMEIADIVRHIIAAAKEAR